MRTTPLVGGPEVPALLSVAEVAARLRMSPSAAYRAVERGDLRTVRLHQDRGSIRIPVTELLRILDGGLEEDAT